MPKKPNKNRKKKLPKKNPNLRKVQDPAAVQTLTGVGGLDLLRTISLQQKLLLK